MKLLAIRLGYQKTIAKSLVMSEVVGFGMTTPLSFRPKGEILLRFCTQLGLMGNPG